MPIEDYNAAAQKIAALLKTITTTGGLRLKYRITAGDGAADPHGFENREIYVELSGTDAPLLTQRGGELLYALEHVAAKVLRLENDENDKVSFDTNSFKAIRANELREAAEAAAERVRRTGQPFSFAPMSSRERRMLHLAFRDYDDVATSSVGEGSRRFLVAHAKDYDTAKLAALATATPPFSGGRSGGHGRDSGRERSRSGDRSRGRGGNRGGDRRR